MFVCVYGSLCLCVCVYGSVCVCMGLCVCGYMWVTAYLRLVFSAPELSPRLTLNEVLPAGRKAKAEGLPGVLGGAGPLLGASLGCWSQARLLPSFLPLNFALTPLPPLLPGKQMQSKLVVNVSPAVVHWLIQVKYYSPRCKPAGQCWPGGGPVWGRCWAEASAGPVASVGAGGGAGVAARSPPASASPFEGAVSLTPALCPEQAGERAVGPWAGRGLEGPPRDREGLGLGWAMAFLLVGGSCPVPGWGRD